MTPLKPSAQRQSDLDVQNSTQTQRANDGRHPLDFIVAATIFRSSARPARENGRHALAGLLAHGSNASNRLPISSIPSACGLGTTRTVAWDRSLPLTVAGAAAGSIASDQLALHVDISPRSLFIHRRLRASWNHSVRRATTDTIVRVNTRTAECPLRVASTRAGVGRVIAS